MKQVIDQAYRNCKKTEVVHLNFEFTSKEDFHSGFIDGHKVMLSDSGMSCSCEEYKNSFCFSNRRRGIDLSNHTNIRKNFSIGMCNHLIALYEIVNTIEYSENEV